MFDQVFISFLGEFYQNVWWFILPIALGFILFDRWIFTARVKYITGIEWTTLEVKVPPDIAKTPKAMEQIFADLHGIYSRGTWTNRYVHGRVVPWLVFEVIANNGEVSFYVHTPVHYRNMVEAKIYAQYQKAEIRQIEDYLKKLPPVIPNKDYECSGTELILERELFPIRTYMEFESTVEEYRLDPLSHFSELADKLGQSEYLGIQFFIEPAFGSFKQDSAALVDQILDRTVVKNKRTFFDEVIEYAVNLGKGVFSPPQWSDEKPSEPRSTNKALSLSPGERSDLEALERKVSKLFFKTGIRFIYISKKDVFQKAMPSAIYGFFRLFNNPRTNSFLDNPNVRTRSQGLFMERKEFIRKRNLYYNYVRRMFPRRTSFLNTEELATLFHFPSMMVESPGLRSVQAKKGSPPTELPIVY